jgi:hypothetical protein
MAGIPQASIKDLLSTGYFFDDLKSHPKTAEIDLITYNKDFVLPHLSVMLKSYESSGQLDRGAFLKVAIQSLSTASDDDMADYIVELRKIAASEVEANEKALVQNIPLNKSERLICRRNSESAQSLMKLFVAIIRAFKLTEVASKRDSKGQKPGAPLLEAIEGVELTIAPSD